MIVLKLLRGIALCWPVQHFLNTTIRRLSPFWIYRSWVSHRRIAVHESGHVIAAFMEPKASVLWVSVMPTLRLGGSALICNFPHGVNKIALYLAGREAERQVYSDANATEAKIRDQRARSDLVTARSIARSMAWKQVLLRVDAGTIFTPARSTMIRSRVDQTTQHFLKIAEQRAARVLRVRQHDLLRLTNALVKSPTGDLNDSQIRDALNVWQLP